MTGESRNKTGWQVKKLPWSAPKPWFAHHPRGITVYCETKERALSIVEEYLTRKDEPMPEVEPRWRRR